ncbi:MAG TPA: hypothetical protein VF092_31570, partial [Longimicrobium sp.]
MFVPSLLLKQLYTFGSLKNSDDGVQFSIKNRLSDATVTGLRGIRINGQEIPLHDVEVRIDDSVFHPHQITSEQPLSFPLKRTLQIVARRPALPLGKHDIELAFDSKPFGKLKLSVQDAIAESAPAQKKIPRSDDDDYSDDAIRRRQGFVEEFCGARLDHVKRYSFDPHLLKGNCEHFSGVAQVPIGFAGPLEIHGEHAQGDFLIPLATTEGTLVASYNRGMHVLNACGGVKVTVVGDAMQRAPVFVFDDARAGREFLRWVQEHAAEITAEAEATSSVAKLQYIDPY